MDKIRKVWSVCLQDFKKLPTNPRTYVILILIYIFMDMAVSPFGSFSDYTSVAVSPWILPFVMSDQYYLFVIMLGVVLLFCDAPFLDSQQPYLLIRTGRTCWYIGHIIYIAFASMVYFVFTWILSIVPILRNIGFSLQWGKIIKTFALTNAGDNYGLKIPIIGDIVQNYTPFSVMWRSILIYWLVAFFLGLLIFTLNLYFNRAVGTMVAAGIVLFEMLAFNGGTSLYKLRFFSPVSWASYLTLSLEHRSNNPTFLYAISVLSILIIILIVFSWLSIRNKIIEVLPQI
jgi:hypothetical protein